MILITTYYLSDSLERQKEIDRCLFININNKHIKKIYLLTNLRTYNVDNRIHGKYCLIKPCHLNEKIDVSFMDY